jgi:hypothetical protein
MPLGTGSETLNTLPQQGFVTDPAAFFQLTKKRVYNPLSFAAPGPGAARTLQLPQAGIVSKLLVTFVGSVTVANGTGTTTTTNEWPHNVLKAYKLNINGQNELHNLSGIDLAVLRYVRYPAYGDVVDQFPGNVGGGDALTNGEQDVHLTWEVPIAIDDVSLIGSLFLQSAASNVSATFQQAANDDLFTLTGDATVSIDGTFYVEMTTFEVPTTAEGNIVVPDLSRLHGINVVPVPFTNIGENRVALVRSSGQLTRLLVSAENAPNQRLSAKPGTAAASRLDALSLEYGARHRPFSFEPASSLLAINNHHYGGLTPYDRLVLDQVKENPTRDAINMQGLTELAVVVDVNSAVAITNGRIRVVQETLFSAAA